mgnify:CR=1 FL=1
MEKSFFPEQLTFCKKLHCAQARFSPLVGDYNMQYGNYKSIGMWCAFDMLELKQPAGFRHRATTDVHAMRMIWNWLEATQTQNLLANVLQVGFLLAPKSITPKASKLNPLEGAKRVFGMSAFVKAGLDSLKVALVLCVVILTVNGMHDKVMLLPMLPLPAALLAVGELMMQLALRIALVLLILGLLDYLWQKHRHKEGLKMTKQQVRDEFKQMDGDPQLKQRRMQFARQLAQQRISSAVPKADVIVTNPTHISVALQWDQATMDAPVVVAMGADHLALRIRQIAMQHSVPILERKPLARALYAQVNVGDEIPHDLYQAVSEVLAYVYRLEGRAVG